MARSTTANNVVLHGDDTSRDRKDGVAQAAITPGELLEVTGLATGGADTNTKEVQPHSEVPDLNGNGTAAPRFALEYSHTGGGIDDDYSTDDHVEYRVCDKGDEVYAFIAAGENVSVDTPLESAGNGALQAHSGLEPAGDGTDTMADGLVVAHTLESVDNSGGADPVRIRVEVN